MSEEAVPYVVTGDSTPRYHSPMAETTSPILIFNLNHKAWPEIKIMSARMATGIVYL